MLANGVVGYGALDQQETILNKRSRPMVVMVVAVAKENISVQMLNVKVETKMVVGW